MRYINSLYITLTYIIGTQQIINLFGMTDSKKTFINNNIIYQHYLLLLENKKSGLCPAQYLFRAS